MVGVWSLKMVKLAMVHYNFHYIHQTAANSEDESTNLTKTEKDTKNGDTQSKSAQ